MSENLPYDPDLKTAALEIQEILDKYKIGGNIVLTSKTHAEYLYHFPDWSIVQFDKTAPGMGAIRIKSKRKNFKSKKEQHQISECSTHLIAQNRDISAKSFQMFDDIFKLLEQYFDIEHEPYSGHTPHYVS